MKDGFPRTDWPSTVERSFCLDPEAGVTLHNQHIDALRENSDLFLSDRFTRLRHLPIKTAFPRALRYTGRTHRSRASTFFGRRMHVLLPEPVSVTIWRYGFFEIDVCWFFLALLRPGDCCVDVGGHFGFFSMLARELVGSEGTVVTFEPMPDTRKILSENMEQNAAPANHRLVPSAAGAAPGRLRFKDFGLTGSAFATSASQRSTAVKVVGEIDVEVRTVDRVVGDMGLPSVRLIKIDAENAEFDVIQGSLDTIRNLRPALIIEAGDLCQDIPSTRRVLDLLMAEDYTPFEFRDWSIRTHAVTEHYGYQNLLMVPRERAVDMVGAG